MLPNDTGESERTTSSIDVIERPTLKQKVMNWIRAFDKDSGSDDSQSKKPLWNKKFWTPIDLEVDVDNSMVILCQLNFQEYNKNPHKYSMFRDFVAVSSCTGANRKREKLSVLLKQLSEVNKNGLKVIQPSGFVFHESRVGSTLVANTLASDELSMVFSESSPTANALLHCMSCTREQNIQLFRDIVTLMGLTTFHEHMFFKFQSITTTKIDLVLEVSEYC